MVERHVSAPSIVSETQSTRGAATARGTATPMRFFNIARAHFLDNPQNAPKPWIELAPGCRPHNGIETRNQGATIRNQSRMVCFMRSVSSPEIVLM